VYRQEIDEKKKTLDLWVRRKRGNRKLECSGCGRKLADAYDCRERVVRDLPWSLFQTAVHIEVYRVKCPACGVKVEKVPLLPSRVWVESGVPMTFDDVRPIALALDGVEESTSYGTPAFKVRGALIARWRPDLDALVVGMGFAERDELMAADPETYFITDHYLNYEWILVGLARVHPDAMRDLLIGAWRSAAASKRRKRKASRVSRPGSHSRGDNGPV